MATRTLISKVFKVIIRKLHIVFVVLILLSIVFPIIIILFLPMLIIRKSVSQLAKIMRPDLGKIFNTIGTLLAVDDITGKPNDNIVINMRFKGLIDVEAGKTRVNELIGKNKIGNDLVDIELKQYPYKWMGYYFWKWDEQFDISNHVKYYDGAANSQLSRNELHQIEKTLILKPFPGRRSPWECICFPNVQSDNGEVETVVILRFHHVIGDGFALFKFLQRSFLDISEGEKKNTPMMNFPKQNLFQQLCGCFKFIKIPYEMAEDIVKGRDKNDWNIPEKEMSENWTSGQTDVVSLNVIKEAKAALGSSVHAVIFAGLAAAIREAMLKKNGKVPKYIHASVALPLNNHPDKLRNFGTSALIRLPVGEQDPVQRLKKIERHLKKVKRSTLHYTRYITGILVGGLPHWMVKPMIKNAETPTTIGTTFPGPKSILKILGCPVTEMHFSLGPLIGTCSILFFTLTYNNDFKVKFLANESLMQDECEVEEMNKDFLKEFTVLRNCAKLEV